MSTADLSLRGGASLVAIERLAANRMPARFYRGGSALGEFRGERVDASHEPEDWVASTTCVHGDSRAGLTSLADGRLLRDAIAADPDQWLGPAHTARYGPDPMLLVKLLHAGQRLPVHAHPHVSDAKRLCGATHGKAEAWYIVQGGDVHLGLREDQGVEGLARLLLSSESQLLAALHRVAVAPGDVVYVPPGTLHSIGEGVMLVEVQEPSDLSIMLEHEPFGLDPSHQGHLGAGYPDVLSAVTTDRLPPSRLASLVYSAGVATQVLPVEADEYFRLERLVVERPRRLERGYAVLIVTRGSVRLRVHEHVVEAPRGSVFLAPYSAGPLVATGSGEIIVCRPPKPAAREQIG